MERRPTPLEIIRNMREKNFREEIILEEVEKALVAAESPSPSSSLQEAAEAYANDQADPQYSHLTATNRSIQRHYIAGWNAREAQQGGPTVSKKEMVKTPEFGGIGHIPAGQYDTVTFCAETYAMGEFNHHHHCEEHMIAYNGFLSGVNWIFGHMPKLSAPLLTRELFDKIWEAATRWADVGNIDNNPDKETFFTSLNL